MSTPEPAVTVSAVSDALDVMQRAGAVWGVQRIGACGAVSGPAYTVSFAAVEPGAPAPAADYIDEVAPGAVVVLACPPVRATVWGDLLTEVASLRGIAGAVIDGYVRDVDRIRELGFPVWAAAPFMRSGKGRLAMVARQVPVTLGEEQVPVRPGDIVHADGSGVVVVPAGIADEVHRRARAVEEMERAISRAVGQGSSLREARSRYRYHDVALPQRG